MNGNAQSCGRRHIVAIPYPGRGHINPMMNLCKLLVSKYPKLITITFVVTEEWLALLSSAPKPPPPISLQTIPNVIPSEQIRASIFPRFVKAVYTKMEGPVEKLLDRLSPISAIIADTYVPWAVPLANRKNIPLASLWTMSPSVFSIFYHFHLVIQNGHFPADLSERGHEIIEYIPGVSSTHLADLPGVFSGVGKEVMDDVLEAFSWMRRAQCVLFSSFEEFENQVINKLKATLPFPVYSVGPLIPHTTVLDSAADADGNGDEYYFTWLDSQPVESVLYISLGSFLSVSREQMDEIIHGVRESGVRYLWVARVDTSHVQEACGEMGLVVPWCDQLKVLCHSSVGGFWTHCGWNSTLEGAFAGVPMLTFPIFFDQIPNRKLIVDDWEIGMKFNNGADNVVGRNMISTMVQRFMDLDAVESKKMRAKSSLLKQTCRHALSNGGSSAVNLDAFVRNILKNN